MSLILASAAIDGSEVELLSAVIEHGCNQISHSDCELSAGADSPPPKDVIGKTLTLQLERDDGSSKTTFSGQIVEASLVGEDGQRPTLKLHAEARLWRLRKRRDSRVFQEMTTEDIVRDVLERAGIADQQWQLNGSYEPRGYCVQHRETDLAFITRLLAEDGINFTTEAQDGDDVALFWDTDLGDVDGTAELSYTPEFGFDTSRDAVTRLRHSTSVRSDKVVMRDYDFERPDFELAGEHEGSDDGDKSLEIYHYPARTNKAAVAKHYAQTMLEAQQCRRETISGESLALHLAPGRRIRIAEHPYEPLNQDCLLLRVTFRYRGSRWHADDDSREAMGCHFEAMPQAAGPYRPELLEPARAVAGYDSAVVVGPGGSEIHPDEYGRVKAQLLWDREGDGSDKASCWMRATQTPLGGGLLTPRVGWEVSLRHLDGDPDQPIVTGRMITAKAPPPYALPEHKTRSVVQTATSPGGGSVNELRFDDKKGAEEMFLNGSKNMSVSAGNNATETIGANEVRKIGANQEIAVTGAKESVSGTQLWKIGGSQTLGVSTYMVDDNGGAHTLSVGGSRDLTIGGDHRRLVGGSSSLKVSGIQVDLVAGSVTESTVSPMNDTIGSALVELAGGGRNVVCAARVESVGAVKAVLATGGRGVEVGAAMTHSVAGAIAIKTKAGFNDNSKGAMTVVAGGAQLVKATNVTFTAKTLLTVICGGSTLTLTPGSVTLAGASIKLDGVAAHTAAMIKDN